MKTTWTFPFGLCAAVLSLALVHASFAAESAAEKQQKLLAILKSDAPPADKAVPFKQLAIFGDKDAVPVIAPYLADKDLSSWARIALQNIPGPEADAALRDAASKLQGNLLIGVVNTIGLRRDTKAVDVLASKLSDGNVEIVGAAAAALGNVSGKEAAKALSQAFASAGKPSLNAIAEGLIICAENFYNAGQFADAVPLYESVRKADVPKQRWLEATRGAILARQSDGLPLLLEQLRSGERTEFNMALRTARELKGEAVTKALASEMDRAGSDREVMLVHAIADRKDTVVFPTLLQATQRKNKPVRVAALGLLDRFGDVSAVPVLLSAAAESDAEIASPAKDTLTRMEGKPVDDALLKQLPAAKGKTRQVIIELAALRRIQAAVPEIVPAVKDSDAGVRRAALSSLTALGTEQHIPNLVSLITETKNPDDRETIEPALAAIAGRAGAKSISQLSPLTKSGDAELRKVSVRTMATIGGSEALASVSKAFDDADESVRDEAASTLATWPNNWPDDSAVADALLNLIKTGKKRSHQVQGARGYLLYVQQNTTMKNAEKVAAIEKVLPLFKQPAEKKLAVSALGNIPSGSSLAALQTLAADPSIADEASAALVNVATARNIEGATKDARRAALQTAAAKTKIEATRKKANDALNAIK